MKKTLIIISSLFLIMSCSNDLDCNSELAKQTVKEILIDLENSNKLVYSMNGIRKKDISKIIKEYVVIKNVRTTAINKELKSCECRATLTLDLEESASKVMRGNDVKVSAMILGGELLNIDGTEIFYNIQETADGELMAETYEISGLDVTISILNNILKKIETEYKKGDVLIFKDKVNNGLSQYKLTFLKENKLDIEYTYFDYKQNEIADYKNGVINVNGDGKLYILEGDIFKARNPESYEYDLFYKK